MPAPKRLTNSPGGAGAGGTDPTAIHTDVAAEISTLTEKASPVSGDLLVIEDSAAANAKKKVQIGNLPGGTGDITGPGSSTDHALARWDGTGGDALLNSAIISDDSHNVTGMATLTLPNTGLHLLADVSYDLIIVPGSVLSADRNLTLTTGDAARTVTLSADLTVPADPNADRVFGWDDSAGATAYFTPGAGLFFSTTNLYKKIAPIQLHPYEAKLVNVYAKIDAADNNWRLLFDDSTDGTATWEFMLDPNWSGGTLYADILYSMTSATTNTVDWEVSIMAYTPGDSADIGTDSYDTANAATSTVPGTAGYMKVETITLTNADSAAAGDYIRLKLNRDANDGTNDTATGNAEVVLVVVRE